MIAKVGEISRNTMDQIRTETCRRHGYDETNWLKRGPREKKHAAGE